MNMLRGKEKLEKKEGLFVEERKIVNLIYKNMQTILYTEGRY